MILNSEILNWSVHKCKVPGNFFTIRLFVVSNESFLGCVVNNVARITSNSSHLEAKMSLEGQNGIVSMPDMQNTRDIRRVPIDRVGVSNVRYPIKVLDRAKESQHSTGTFTLTVSLSEEYKGTHMSRFLEALNVHTRDKCKISKCFPDLI